MIETILRRLVAHKRRKSIIIIVTILTGLLVGLPAADEYNAARGRVSSAAADIAAMQTEFADQPRFQQLFETKNAQLKRLESKAVSEAAAQRLQSDLVEMVRQSGCTMRQIRQGEPLRHDWTTKDHPVRGVNVADRGAETPYQLETRQISLSLTGPMANVLEFMSQIHRLDQLLHCKRAALKRADESGNTAIMDMDLLLFNLIKKPAP